MIIKPIIKDKKLLEENISEFHATLLLEAIKELPESTQVKESILKEVIKVLENS